MLPRSDPTAPNWPTSAVGSMCSGWTCLARLRVGGDFDLAKSDIDLLVTYDPDLPRPSLAEYFGLRDALSSLLGHPVDLVMAGAVRNPYVRTDIESARELLYAA